MIDKQIVETLKDKTHLKKYEK